MHRRYYRNLLPRPQSPPRRSSVSGTDAEIQELRHRHRHITDKWSYHRRTANLQKEHLVHDYHKAEEAFVQGDFFKCQDLCFGILAEEPISDTIKAKTYMLMARKEVVKNSPTEREYYAEQAMYHWDVVIGRVGYCHTRYPVGLAREQRRIARELLDDARMESNDDLADEIVLPPEDKENIEQEVKHSPAAQESQEL